MAVIAKGGAIPRGEAGRLQAGHGSAQPSPPVSPQILGLTFAMTMYCQVVKADTYCA